ncbi:glutathione peroxidase [Carboxylicivirga marina]|uniref:Glutathione peroxidase n=1 Tax=Carboxylicivirga marina TaxID=2800988 RepID=A0ABS1HGN9_9BACT|nr:glutathione peroxidase [Carboxylicivirga marina]MBK3516835.1 glutathione peroxidase [Carboxylicivirga marina]
MKIIYSLILLFNISIMSSFAQKSFYDFEVNTIEGKTYDLSQLKGKKVMIVNVASKCGLTPQYEQLQQIFEMYGGDNFTIIGFPANNFMSQEPGTNDEIATFCQKNYGVTFQMMSKISVKGDDMHPLYHWLTTKTLNKHSDSSVKWNFQKYLINEKGELEKVISPKTKPNDEEVISWINS